MYDTQDQPEYMRRNNNRRMRNGNNSRRRMRDEFDMDMNGGGYMNEGIGYGNSRRGLKYDMNDRFDGHNNMFDMHEGPYRAGFDEVSARPRARAEGRG